MSIRIPGWYKSGSVPGDLYVHGGNAFSATPGIAINGKPVLVTDNDGYLSVNREWRQGDIVEFEFAMNTYTVTAKDSLKQNNNRIAIQRGPIVYCVEGADNNNKAWNIVLPADTKFETIDYKILDEPVKALTAEVPVVLVAEDGLSIRTEKRKIIAIPYYTWANRGKNEMQVWLPTTIKDVKINY